MNSLKIFVVFAIALLGLYWNYLYIAQYGRHACSYLFLFFSKRIIKCDERSNLLPMQFKH